jgi:outer membrane immunogenic protein
MRLQISRGALAIVSTGIAVAALVAAGPVAAADMGVVPATAVAVPPYYNWNGFYIGAHVGGAWDQRFLSQTPAVPGTFIEIAAIDPSGAFGGGQIGYNWNATPSLLLGLEADVSGTRLTGSARTFNFAGTGPGWNVKDDVFGTRPPR